MSALRPCPHCGHLDLTAAPSLAVVLGVVERNPNVTSRGVAVASGKSIQNALNHLRRLESFGLVRSEPQAQPSGGYELVWRRADV